jgi:hypothetical protein
MADIQCGRFQAVAVDPETGRSTWIATINSTPTEGWGQAFHSEHGDAVRLGVCPSSDFTISYVGKTIAFMTSDDMAPAIATAFRDIVDKANRAAARFDDERRQMLDAETRRESERQESALARLARLRERYPDGL